MPTYDYECKHCTHTFEHFQSMSDEPLAICPECGGELRRLIGGGSGVIFKGSGFYVTDSRRGSKNKQNADSPSNETKETKKDTVGAGTKNSSGSDSASSDSSKKASASD
jgi:putative FmdB family regulatory protein